MNNEKVIIIKNNINNLIDIYKDIYNSNEDSNKYFLQELMNLKAILECETENLHESIRVEEVMTQMKETLDHIKNDMYSCVNAEKPRKIDKSAYVSMIYNNLSTIFLKWGLLEEHIAIKKYKTIGVLQSEWFDFLDIIQKINNIGIVFIPDKIMLAAYLQIDIETFDKFRTDSDIVVSKMVNTMNAHLVALKINASETGERKDKATIENLKIKNFGHAVEQVKQEQEIIVTPRMTNEDYKLKFEHINKLIDNKN